MALPIWSKPYLDSVHIGVILFPLNQRNNFKATISGVESPSPRLLYETLFPTSGN